MINFLEVIDELLFFSWWNYKITNYFKMKIKIKLLLLLLLLLLFFLVI